MSTRIKDIKGSMGTGIHNERIPTTLSITRFASKERMVQLTVHNAKGYIQLTKKEAHDMANVLLNSFDNKIYPTH